MPVNFGMSLFELRRQAFRSFSDPFRLPNGGGTGQGIALQFFGGFAGHERFNEEAGRRDVLNVNIRARFPSGCRAEQSGKFNFISPQ